MDETIPSTNMCLTTAERRELQQAWTRMLAALQPLGDLVDHADEVDCNMLHQAFLKLADEFENVEHLVMRAKQIRLLHAGHGGEVSD